MCDSGSGIGEKTQLVIVEVNPVRIPDVRSDPSAFFHIGKRTHPQLAEGKALFILRLTQVRMQPYTQRAGQRRRFDQQVFADAEG